MGAVLLPEGVEAIACLVLEKTPESGIEGEFVSLDLGAQWFVVVVAPAPVSHGQVFGQGAFGAGKQRLKVLRVNRNCALPALFDPELAGVQDDGTVGYRLKGVEAGAKGRNPWIGAAEDVRACCRLNHSAHARGNADRSRRG